MIGGHGQCYRQWHRRPGWHVSPQRCWEGRGDCVNCAAPAERFSKDLECGCIRWGGWKRGQWGVGQFQWVPDQPPGCPLGPAWETHTEFALFNHGAVGVCRQVSRGGGGEDWGARGQATHAPPPSRRRSWALLSHQKHSGHLSLLSQEGCRTELEDKNITWSPLLPTKRKEPSRSRAAGRLGRHGDMAVPCSAVIPPLAMCVLQA